MHVVLCWSFTAQVFCEVAYKAKTAQDLVNGIDEYMEGLTVLPPSVWDPQTRLEPPNKSMTVVRLITGFYSIALMLRQREHAACKEYAESLLKGFP